MSFIKAPPKCLDDKVYLNLKSIMVYTNTANIGYHVLYCNICNSYLYNGRMEKDPLKIAKQCLRRDPHFANKKYKIEKVETS